jgi:ADP-ribose 1''-phosphate phosphatase
MSEQELLPLEARQTPKGSAPSSTQVSRPSAQQTNEGGNIHIMGQSQSRFGARRNVFRTAWRRSTPRQRSQNPQNRQGTPIRIIEETGDLFNSPDRAVLIHACNCLGSWGGGIAAEFRRRYPEAHRIYQNHCSDNSLSNLIGTALLIPPSEHQGPQHWVGCVFTSKRVGRHKDTPPQIIRNTELAMTEMLRLIAEQGQGAIVGIYMCRINAGLFNVPWRETKYILQSLDVDLRGMAGDIHVIRPPNEAL